MENDIYRDIFLAFVRVHILHHAAQEAVFGLEMMEELRHHGYTLSPGTLYPIFHSLEKGGYLTSASKVVAGKTRKYYQATARGKKLLAELREKIRELVSEVLGFDEAGGMRTRGGKKQKTSKAAVASTS